MPFLLSTENEKEYHPAYKGTGRCKGLYEIYDHFKLVQALQDYVTNKLKNIKCAGVKVQIEELLDISKALGVLKVTSNDCL